MGNRIPREFDLITAETLVDSSAYKKGTIVQIFKDDHGYLSKAVGETTFYREFVSRIRNENLYKILSVV